MIDVIETRYEPIGASTKQARAVEVTKQPVHLTTPTEVRVDGETRAVYLSEAFHPDRYIKTLRSLKFDGPKTLSISNKFSTNGANAGGMRMSGINTQSVTFGAIQALPGRRRFQASMCRNNTAQPKVWNATQWLLQETMQALADYLHLPFGDYADKVGDAWKVGASPFTSLIVNSGSSPYPYHKDSGNTKGSWSAMPVIRGRNGSGGHLAVPELGVSFECGSGSVLAFPGAELWHGVTPIIGDRWSIVYYTKSGLETAAQSVEEELRQGQQRRTQYELEGVNK